MTSQFSAVHFGSHLFITAEWDISFQAIVLLLLLLMLDAGCSEPNENTNNPPSTPSDMLPPEDEANKLRRKRPVAQDLGNLILLVCPYKRR